MQLWKKESDSHTHTQYHLKRGQIDEKCDIEIEWDQSNTFDFVSDDGLVSIWFVGGIFGIFLFIFFFFWLLSLLCSRHKTNISNKR